MHKLAKSLAFAGMLSLVPACQPHYAQVASVSILPLKSLRLYETGVGYFERAGMVRTDTVEFQLRENDVGDFLGSLAVM